MMTDNKDKIKKKKTLSLKLGSKPMLAPKKNIEAGKTVIVEKKGIKKASIQNPNLKLSVQISKIHLRKYQ